MKLRPNDLTLLGHLVRSLYARPFNEELIADVQETTCRLTDSQYVSFCTFSLRDPLAPVLISNNPAEFIPVYLSVLDGDFLLDAVVTSGKEFSVSRTPGWNCPEHQQFLRPVQDSRPISDILYVPMKSDGCLAGYCGMARAGLHSPDYTSAQHRIFRFITGFVEDAFKRSMLPPAISDDVALVDCRGNIVEAGARAREAICYLFGDGSAASRVRHDVFLDCCRRFLHGPLSPGMDRLAFETSAGYFALLLELIRTRGLALPFDGVPRVSVRLLASRSGQVETPALDLSAATVRHGLTPRECEVIRGVYEAKSNKVIARELGVDESTVKRHTHNIYEKTGLRSRVELVQRLLTGPR